MGSKERQFNFNEYQSNVHNMTQLEDLIRDELDDKEMPHVYMNEVKIEFLELLDSIEFLQNLSTGERLIASDLTRWDTPYLYKTRKEDPNGIIEVNITQPHKLENMDYFRQAALTFESTGRYTHLYPNRNPYSEYTQFWVEEARRCREGMIRPEDGEWIPGYLYFYWNYARIKKVVKNKKTKRASRSAEFPNPYDGDYLFFHYLDKARKSGKHTATLKKRGSGFSFKGGSKLARNFIFGESEEAKEETNSFAIADSKEYLTSDGVLNKFIDMVDFCAENTPFPRLRGLSNSMNKMSWKMGYKDKDSDIEKGTKNFVGGVTVGNDPHRARGKRASLIEFEEVGSFSNFLTVWGVARPSVEEDDEVFGLMNAYGTGGEEGNDFRGLQEIFYSPKGYGILGMPNVFDKNMYGRTKCAFFFPQYLNAKNFYDINGNSDVVGSLIQILVKRLVVKYNTTDPNAIVQEKAERPITPQEAIMRTEGSAYPVAALKDHLETISPNMMEFTNEHYVGDIIFDRGLPKWKPLPDARPIRDFPLKDRKNPEGAIEIFEMPKKNRDEKVFKSRYIAGSDPVDNDYTIGSLASIFIFDTWTDRIVAEYTGRPVLASEYYRKCMMLCLFYNAKLNYENNLKGLFSYFSNENCVYLLSDTPQYLRDMEVIGSEPLRGNKAKGTRTTKEVIKMGKTLQREWMLTQQEYLEYDAATGEEIPIFIENYRKIRSKGYLEECIAWNEDGNFDRCSAMDMVMILREDIKKNVSYYKEDRDTYTMTEDDDFIDKNWNNVMDQFNMTNPWGEFNADGMHTPNTNTVNNDFD